MYVWKRIIKLMKNPRRIIMGLSYYGLFNFLADEPYLRMLYWCVFRKKLNLENPLTYNEKLQWLKINDRNPLYTVMADKYAVKQYVKEKIGEEFLIPLLGIWHSYEEIDFRMLPEQFVLKCTHNSKGIVICKNKKNFDIKKNKKYLEKQLKDKFYLRYREYPYRNIPPRIICEAYMQNGQEQELRDIKVLCFHGKAQYIEYHMGRFSKHTQDFYTVNWEKTQINQGNIMSGVVAERPLVLDEIIRLSEILAADVKHLRVDWYIIDGAIYFGEITFYDGAGFCPFEQYEDDIKLSDLIHLNGSEG